MRTTILATAVLLTAAPAMAQTPPAPSGEGSVLRWAAIGTGAAAGATLVAYMTGGLGPIVAYATQGGAPAAVAAAPAAAGLAGQVAATAWWLAEGAAIVAGGVVGGYFGKTVYDY